MNIYRRTGLALVGWAVFISITSVYAEPLEIEEKQYKRIHITALQAIVDGNADGAIDALQAYGKEHPEDTETPYMLAVGYAVQDKPKAAMKQVVRAVEVGLPIERFLAGPRGLLRPLLDHKPFQNYAAERAGGLVHGPMVGRVTDESASFWVRTAREADVCVVLRDGPNGSELRRSVSVRTQADKDYTAVILLDGLEADTAYHYSVEVEGASKSGDGVYSFRTFPETGQPAAFRIGFGGGAGFVPPHERVWDVVRAQDPIAFLLLGDNVYIDHPTYPEIQQYCYYRRQSRPEYRRLGTGSAIYAIYDDHDFGDNDCWGGPEIDDPAWKRPVWRLFTNNWVNPAYGGGEAQPGCWFDTMIGDVHFVFLDCRYYRTTPKRSRRSERSMLGPVQMDWLFDTLERGKDAPFTVIASSVPWAIGTKPGSQDTWDGYATERERIFSFIEDKAIEGVLLLSADRHRSDVWRVDRENGYDFYEFESSRLTNQHVHKELPEALFSYNNKQSFGIIDFDTRADDPSVTYSIINIDGEKVHEMTVNRSQLTMSAGETR